MIEYELLTKDNHKGVVRYDEDNKKFTVSIPEEHELENEIVYFLNQKLKFRTLHGPKLDDYIEKEAVPAENESLMSRGLERLDGLFNVKVISKKNVDSGPKKERMAKIVLINGKEIDIDDWHVFQDRFVVIKNKQGKVFIPMTSILYIQDISSGSDRPYSIK